MKLNKRFLLLLCLILLALVFHSIEQHRFIRNEENVSSSCLIVVAPQDFKDEEYFTTKKILEQNGCSVLTFSSRNYATSVNKVKIRTIPLDNLSAYLNNASALILIGGPGVLYYENNSELFSLVNTAYSENKTLGAICLAPLILAESGVLKGKRATVWGNSFAQKLERLGVNYVDKPVVVDGRIITSNGPEHAGEFANKIISNIKG